MFSVPISKINQLTLKQTEHKPSCDGLPKKPHPDLHIGIEFDSRSIVVFVYILFI